MQNHLWDNDYQELYKSSFTNNDEIANIFTLIANVELNTASADKAIVKPIKEELKNLKKLLTNEIKDNAKKLNDEFKESNELTNQQIEQVKVALELQKEEQEELKN